ncbi:hypothetical protein PEBR_20104 [Penicillium brasilianum]|uniref:Uncharacterized protein n=1 Tax=Penicillium brasilianum TaxID=104259 RepID=A0A1S9RPI6_PENBI|nr:hypothetical protein PEBR_20104 [Penicillium brasilianum]
MQDEVCSPPCRPRTCQYKTIYADPPRPVLQPEVLDNHTLAHGPMELESPVICTAPEDAVQPNTKEQIEPRKNRSPPPLSQGPQILQSSNPQSSATESC